MCLVRPDEGPGRKTDYLGTGNEGTITNGPELSMSNDWQVAAFFGKTRYRSLRVVNCLRSRFSLSPKLFSGNSVAAWKVGAAGADTVRREGDAPPVSPASNGRALHVCGGLATPFRTCSAGLARLAEPRPFTLNQ